MAKLSISVLGDSGDVKCHAQGEEDIVWMVYQEEYEPGDQILFSTDELLENSITLRYARQAARRTKITATWQKM